MAVGLDGPALDRGGHGGSRKRLPTIEGAQATSGTTCRSASTSNEKVNSRRPCSSSQRRVTSTSATAASQCSTKSGTSPEYLDGLGYPDGLTAPQISDLVRLLTISDIFADLIE